MAQSYLLNNSCLVCSISSDKMICKNCIDKLSYFPKKNYLKYSNNFYFDNVYSLFNFNDILKKIIHLYKFDNKRKLSSFFSELLLEHFTQDFFNAYDYIVLTPLHKNKYRKRGFNQTSLIIEKLVPKDRIFLDIIRDKNTKQQSLLNTKNERIKNLENSFIFKKNMEKQLIDKKILIFDDIFTTGTTLNSLAKIFYFTKVKQIDVLTLGIV